MTPETDMRRGLAGLSMRQSFFGVAVCIALTALVQSLGHIDRDVSWFITFAEQVYDGARAYVDISDPNPPMAFLLYMPSVAVARALHIAIEPVVVGFMLAWGVVSLMLYVRILEQGQCISDLEKPWLWLGGAFIVCFMPAFCFAQREHAVLLALLPGMAAVNVRADGGRVAAISALIAGFCAGLALAFKPIYVAALGAAWLVAWVRKPSIWRAMWPEYIGLGLSVAIYSGILVFIYPEYLKTIVPLVAHIYATNGAGVLDVVKLSIFWFPALVVCAAFVLTQRPISMRLAVWLAACIGCLFVYVIQFKGWINHGLPAVGAALFAGLFFVLDHKTLNAARLRFCLGVLLPFTLLSPLFLGAQLLRDEEVPGLRDALAKYAPAHPRMMMLAFDMDYGHPIARQIDGTWVGTQNRLWISMAAKLALESETDPNLRARLFGYIRDDFSVAFDNISVRNPNVIIVDSHALSDLPHGDELYASALRGFYLAAHVNSLELWVRDAGADGSKGR